MAIQFLNTVDLNFNQLNKAAIQNIPTTDPIVGVLGQLIYNVTDGAIKVCTTASSGATNAVFTEVGGGVESLTIGNATLNTGGVNTGLAVDASSGAVTLTPAIYAGASKVGMVPTGGIATTFLRGDGVFAIPVGAYTSWDVAADSGTTQSVSDGNIVNFRGDTNGGISTKVDNSVTNQAVFFKLDINDLTSADVALTDFIAFDDASDSNNTRKVSVTDLLALAPQGDITAVEASDETFELGIILSSSSGPIPKVGLDIAGQTALGTTPEATDELLIYDLSATTNKKVTVANLMAAAPAGTVTGIDAGTFVTIDTTDAAVPIVNAEGTTLPTASKLVARNASGLAFAETPASGSSDKTLATTAFVQAKLTGLLEFKGGFNATTGALDDGSGDDLYTDVVIAVGDYYVVTTAGDFFGNAATPLTVGDSVIAQKAVPDPGTTAAVEGDFVVVQSDTDLATAATVGIGNVEGTANQIGVTYSAGTGTITNLDRGSSQNIFKTITAPAGGDVVAGSNSDTLDFTASGGMTITNTPGSNTVNFSSVNNNTEYTAGTGLTLSAGDVFSANVNATAQTVAANAVSATAARTYAVQVDSSDDLVVNVPWADTNTGALGKRVSLDTSLAYVTAGDNGGVRMFSIEVDNSNVFGTGVIARNVKCEVIDGRTTPAGVAGQTVYADITRGVDNTTATPAFGTASLNISFVGTPASGDYEVLLTYVG